MKNLSAVNLFPDEGFRGLGPLGLEGKSSVQGPAIFTKVISSFIGIITVIAIIWFIFKILMGGIAIASSGGDKGKLQEAKGQITSGLIGFFVVIVGIFVVEMIGTLLGLSFLNLEEIINFVLPIE